MMSRILLSTIVSKISGRAPSVSVAVFMRFNHVPGFFNVVDIGYGYTLKFDFFELG